MTRAMVLAVVGAVVAAGLAAAPAVAATDKVVLVAGSSALPAGDRPISDLLDTLFSDVVVVDDDEVDLAGTVSGHSPDLVVVSSSVNPAVVGTRLSNIAVPLVTWEGYLGDELGFTAGLSGTQGETGPAGRTIHIADPAHPIAAGFAGTAFVTFADRRFSFVRPVGAQIVATADARSDKAVIAAWDTGDSLAFGPAPARRVFLFPVYDTPRVLTPSGEDLLIAAISWATSGSTTPPANTPPTVDAGADTTITLPTDTVSLVGAVTDDGRPVPPGVVVTSWSGPPGVVFGDAASVATTATFPGAGTFLVVLTADDGSAQVSDTVSVTVEAQPDLAPTVDAGPDQTVVLPVAAVDLDGTVVDDGVSPVTLAWSQTGGPAGVTFSAPDAADTTATFPAAGTYTLELAADDAGNPAVTDEVQVIVANPDPDPGQTAMVVAGSLSPPLGDRQLIQAVSDFGLDVVLVDDDAIAAADVSTADVLLISTSVVLSKVGDHFVDADLPVLIWEGYLFDEMLLASGAESSATYTQMTVVDDVSPLAAGSSSGNVTVYTMPNRLSFGRPAPGAQVIAHRPGNPRQATFMAFETGAERRDGTPAPRRRVAMFMNYFGAQKLTSSAIEMFHAALAYLLVPDNEPPVANPDRGVTDERTVLSVGPGITALTAFGSTGTGTGEFTFPLSVDIDPQNGGVVVGDNNNHRVQICTDDATCAAFGTAGSNVGEFIAPLAVAVDAANSNVVVADRGNDRIQICDQSGTCTAFGSAGTSPGRFDDPSAVAVDPTTGDIVVADTGNHRIQVCTQAGDCTAFGGIGTLAGEFGAPRGVAIDPANGDIVVADTTNDRVQICDRTGSCTPFAVGQVQDPHGVVVNPFTEDIVIADTGNDRILICDRSELCTPFGGPGTALGLFNDPRDVAFDAVTGNIAVADTFNDRVQVLAAGGVLANDVDPDGDQLTISAFDITSTEGATVIVNNDGSYTYDPTSSTTLHALADGETLIDTFTYTADDGNGGHDTATVAVEVHGVTEGAYQLGGGSDDRVRGIAVDSDGNTYTAGFFQGTADFDPGPGVFNLTSAGGADVFVSKLDAFGEFVWARGLGGTGPDDVFDIAVDAAGSVYASGQFWATADFDPGPGAFNLTSTAFHDGFVWKLDSGGNFVWARQLGSTGSIGHFGVAIDGTGNVYTTAGLAGTVDFDPGPGEFNLTSLGGTDAFVLKLDSAGNFAWVRQFGGPGFQWGRKVAIDSAGNVLTTGYFDGTADFDPGLGVFNMTAGGPDQTFVSKLDSAGNFVWARHIGIGGNHSPWSDIAVDADGNVFTTGFFEGTADFDPGPATFNLTSAATADTRDMYVSKLDGSGDFVWATQVDVTGRVLAPGLAVDSVGAVYTTGQFLGTVDFDPGPGVHNLSTVNTQAFVMKQDSSGDLVWARQTQRMPGGAVGSDVAIGPSGHVHTTGNFGSTVDFDPGPGTFTLSTPSGADVYVWILDRDGNLI